LQRGQRLLKQRRFAGPGADIRFTATTPRAANRARFFQAGSSSFFFKHRRGDFLSAA